MPIVEEMLRGYPFDAGNIRGRLDGTLPRAGELNPTLVAQALGRIADLPATTSPKPSWPHARRSYARAARTGPSTRSTKRWTPTEGRVFSRHRLLHPAEHAALTK